MNYVLFMYADPGVRDWYTTSIQTRNSGDSGFDLFIPETIITGTRIRFNIDFRVKCAMYKLGDTPIENALEQRDTLTPQAFYLYSRSSISKTNYRLSNSVGIIDNQYRGNIGAYFDSVEFLNADNAEILNEKTRLVQLCHPTLEPFHIIMVDSEEQLGTTVRGAGGFGSTGV